jgi:phospholipid transport system substrate-binding protein
MKIRKTFLLYFISLCILVISSGAKAAPAPTDAISETVNSILDTLRDKELSQPAKETERREKIGMLIRDRFDFKEMSKRSLARHWKKISPEDQKQFVSIFSDLLEASYIGKIEKYTDEKVTYDKEKLKGKGKYGVVSTSIVTKSVNIPIDYKLKLKNDKWWVYDVVIEGVSFVSTYRSQYNKIIIKESFAKLIEKMNAQLDKVNAL